jgi:hypothetical protein
VQLDLPETGVCNSDIPVDADRLDASTDGSCCGSTATSPAVEPAAGHGLATGVAGGLLRSPLALIDVSAGGDQQSDSCCG